MKTKTKSAGWTYWKRKRQSRLLKKVFANRRRAAKAKAWHADRRAKGLMHPVHGTPYKSLITKQVTDILKGKAKADTLNRASDETKAAISKVLKARKPTNDYLSEKELLDLEVKRLMSLQDEKLVVELKSLTRPMFDQLMYHSSRLRDRALTVGRKAAGKCGCCSEPSPKTWNELSGLLDISEQLLRLQLKIDQALGILIARQPSK